MVCSACGMYVKPAVQPDRQSVRCPECRHTEPMKLLPLFLVTGASGMGKSTVVAALRPLLPDFDIFDMDLLAGSDWKQVKCSWLRIAHSIAQSGRGTVICGTFVPENIADCAYRPYFSRICYLNLHCEPEEQAARLRARPAYRGTTEEMIAEHQRFAQWLLEHGDSHFDPPLVTVDTTHIPVEETARRIRDWVLGQWEQ